MLFAVLTMGVFGALAWSSWPSSDPAVAASASVSVQYWELRIGDCFQSDVYDEGWQVEVVSCETPHRFEMYEVLFLDPSVEPAADAIEQAAVTLCEEAMPAGLTPGSIRAWPIPTEDFDAGFYDVGCYVAHDSEQVGTVRAPIPPGPVGDQVSEVMAVVEELREIPFLSTPEIEVISSNELRERWAGFVTTQRVEGDPFCELFRPADGCGAAAADALAARVTVYYDGETGRITLPVDGETLTPFDRVMLAHELTHSLTDGHFRWNASGNTLSAEGSTDAWNALNAVVEGDATVVQERYAASYLDAQEQADYENAYNEEIPAAPAFDEAATWFTYGDGAWYVTDLTDQGGLAAVNRSYTKGVPSTEWILDGPDATGDRPVDVDAQLGFPPVGSSLVYYGEWGTLDWFKLLWEDPARYDDVAGWGGASYAVYEDDLGQSLIHIRHVGDDEESVERLFSALAETLPGPMAVGTPTVDGTTLTAFGDDYLWIGRTGTELRLIAAQDPTDGSRAVQKLLATEAGITEGRIPDHSG
jgi:hypothetical protein